MRKCAFLYLCAILLSVPSSANVCRSDHFVIESGLDGKFLQLVEANAEAYYTAVVGRYFLRGWEYPLKIYYSETESESKELLSEQGYADKAVGSYYVASVSAIYGYRFKSDGQPSCWGDLFNGITRHFIHLNRPDVPAWFEEELAFFFGNQARIVKGSLIITRPTAKYKEKLGSQIARGVRFNIKKLFSVTTEQFDSWDMGEPFAQVFLNWLQGNGQLEPFLKSIQEKGYELPVLEEAVSLPFGRINAELSRFIRDKPEAEIFFEDALAAGGEVEKEQLLLKALELDPDFDAARLELARSYSRSKDYDNCRANLERILSNGQSVEYRPAAVLMGNTYYRQNNYSKALEFYLKSWDYSDCYEYKYRVAYQIANCYYYLKNPNSAKQWYAKFLDFKWEPDKMKAHTAYALKYLGRRATND